VTVAESSTRQWVPKTNKCSASGGIYCKPMVDAFRRGIVSVNHSSSDKSSFISYALDIIIPHPPFPSDGPFGIDYCPWCGEELPKNIGDNSNDAEALIKAYGIKKRHSSSTLLL
jgi:hypothetical protein